VRCLCAMDIVRDALLAEHRLCCPPTCAQTGQVAVGGQEPVVHSHPPRLCIGLEFDSARS
jgi:hypothetical protein